MKPALLEELRRHRLRLKGEASGWPPQSLPSLGTQSPELASERRSPVAPTQRSGPIDLLVTHCEVSERHGTGVLLRRLFLDGPPMASVRALDLYGAEQDFGAMRYRLTNHSAGWTEVLRELLDAVGSLEVRRILCVPYSIADVYLALAAREAFGAPMCTWVMDDQNIESQGLPDELLKRLFERSGLLLAISPELQRAYREKFDPRFALAPPAVSARFLLTTPVAPDAERVARCRGMIFGNIWGERWLGDLLETLNGAGVVLDWHSGGGTPWMRIDSAALQRAGVEIRPHVPEESLVAALRASPFVVVPSGTFDGDDSHRFVARLSLPSRLPYLAATAGTPVVILGHPDTAAARFVTRHGLGVVVPYDQQAFLSAVDAVCKPEAQVRHRSAAAKLAPSLSAGGMADWIWRSLEVGGPIDRRFEALETPE